MKQINFLPESYVSALRRRRRIAREATLVAVIGGLLAAGWLIQAGAGAAKANYCASLEDSVRAAQSMQTELVKLRQQYAQLNRQRQIQRELSQPVQHTQVIATIGRLLPQSMAMTELTMTLRRPKPDPLVPQGSTPRKRTKAEQETTPPEPDYLEVELEALAPDGESVAELVKTFAGHPLFTNVWMKHSRSIEVRGVIAREFRLELRVDLDREFDITPMDGPMAQASGLRSQASAKEVARAD